MYCCPPLVEGEARSWTARSESSRENRLRAERRTSPHLRSSPTPRTCLSPLRTPCPAGLGISSRSLRRVQIRLVVQLSSRTDLRLCTPVRRVRRSLDEIHDPFQYLSFSHPHLLRLLPSHAIPPSSPHNLDPSHCTPRTLTSLASQSRSRPASPRPLRPCASHSRRNQSTCVPAHGNGQWRGGDQRKEMEVTGGRRTHLLHTREDILLWQFPVLLEQLTFLLVHRLSSWTWISAQRGKSDDVKHVPIHRPCSATRGSAVILPEGERGRTFISGFMVATVLCLSAPVAIGKERDSFTLQAIYRQID